MDNLNKTNPIELDFGTLLNTHIKKNRIYKSALARKINKSSSTLNEYSKRATVQFSVIVELCHALNHNFFADIALMLPASYTVTVPEDKKDQIQIEDLKREIEILRAEKAVLVEVMGNKV